jgi:hypothetical protein|tara:strand:+ start:153 stop:377 length:225 start_codon:yes stop_codon:yes gene_type:complete
LSRIKTHFDEIIHVEIEDNSVLKNIKKEVEMKNMIMDEQLDALYEGDDGIIEADYGDDIVDRILDGELIQVEMI